MWSTKYIITLYNSEDADDDARLALDRGSSLPSLLYWRNRGDGKTEISSL